MGFWDYVKDKIYEAVFVVLFVFIESIVSLMPIPEPYLTISKIITPFGLFLMGRYILTPAIKFEFYPNRDVVLFKNKRDSRCDNIDLNISIDFKTWTSKLVMSFLCSKYKRDKFFQIYWSPEDALEVIGNNNYPTLVEKGSSLRFQLFEKVDPESSSWDFNYSLKIAVGTVPECTKSTLKLKKSYKNNIGIWHKIIFKFLLRTKFDEKNIELR